MTVPGRSKVAFPIEGDLPHSHAGAHYARVLERLLARDGSSRQVLVTSAGDGEGKTVTAVNLAIAFRARRIPVLLAELSFKRPKFSEIFGPSPLPKGMEDVLAEGTPLQSTVYVLNDKKLSVAMVKKRQKTNNLLLPSPHLDLFLLDARSNYDWTIFDAASVESVPQIQSLAASVGTVLLVARAQHTRPDFLKEALTRIAHPQTLVLLNDA